jgi:hypothetical protein
VVLKRCREAVCDYVKNAPEPLSFDSFQIKRGLGQKPKPLAAMRNTVVEEKCLRRAIDGIAARLPEDAKITDAVRQTALDAVLYAFITRALAWQYQEAAGYALKYLETGKDRTEEENQHAYRQRP